MESLQWRASSGDGAPKLQISVPCRGRTCPDFFAHLRKRKTHVLAQFRCQSWLTFCRFCPILAVCGSMSSRFQPRKHRKSLTKSRFKSGDMTLKFTTITVVAEIITELIRFESEICICNGNPVLPFLVFLEFLVFFPLQGFPCFF